MKLIIHDLSEADFNKIYPLHDKDITIISNNGKINSCVGCYNCWIKTPGRCIFKDGYQDIGCLFSQSAEIVIITKCMYGCYSPFVKNVMDRSLSYLLPFFEKRNSETHHKIRYKNRFVQTVYFYGASITDMEKETAEQLVKANSINNFAAKTDVHFVNDINGLKDILK